MSGIALRTVGLGKMYRIGGERDKYGTLRDTLTQAVKRPLERIRHPGAATHVSEDLWALRGIDFEVKSGVVLGIIGRNGAGKTTLLKVLSHITEPTEGRAEIRGRVASLLEVGTGFHPELTGRENIQLNGAILGMTRAEIKSKFDEIVEFSEISRFLDTPVKRYSSGMYVRLAFAVAAHLQPEILMVDEVLAVGDAEFQKKCLGKMEDVAGVGRTVLFVSHNMAAVSSLCTRAILIKDGRLASDGPARTVVREYIDALSSEAAERSWASCETAPGGSTIRLKAVRAYSARTGNQDMDITDDVLVEIDTWYLQAGAKTSVSIHVKDEMGVVAFVGATDWADEAPGVFRSTCKIPGNLLNDGRYGLRVYTIRDITSIEGCVDDAISFTVHDSGLTRQEYVGHMMGVVRPTLAWTTRRTE
jgi:lipopolysaccharide transport system ATP-binding protein